MNPPGSPPEATDEHIGLLSSIHAQTERNLGTHQRLNAPPFFWLQGAVGLYAAMVSTTGLITQTRQQQHADHRSYLELQISLTAEQKAAKLIELLEELRRDMPSVRDRVDPQADAMARAVDPKAVMSALQETLASAEPVPHAATF